MGNQCTSTKSDVEAYECTDAQDIKQVVLETAHGEHTESGTPAAVIVKLQPEVQPHVEPVQHDTSPSVEDVVVLGSAADADSATVNEASAKNVVVLASVADAGSAAVNDAMHAKPKASAKKHALGQWKEKADPQNQGLLYVMAPGTTLAPEDLIKPRPKPKTKKEAAPKIKLTAEEKAVLERQNKMKARMQAAKDKKEEFERNKAYYTKLAEDALNGTGEFAKKGPSGQPKGNMRIIMPSPADRENTRKLILGQFRDKYAKLGKTKTNVECPSAPTSGYSQLEMQGLTIQGGHQAMQRPTDVKLPKDYMQPVGTITLEQLNKYNYNNHRLLVSVYGDIFDVSDRPDKYNGDGPYWFMSGHDLTWGFVSGRDSEELVDKCYDLWKVAPEGFRDSKLKLIYAWVAWYEYEYGNSVGKLDLYEREQGLKGPPMEESQECCIM